MHPGCQNGLFAISLDQLRVLSSNFWIMLRGMLNLSLYVHPKYQKGIGTISQEWLLVFS